MTRLQKKCLIATAGAHLLVVVAVLCSGFIRPIPQPDNTALLDVIPANLVDAVLNSGVKDAPTPAPTPPTPPPAQPVVTPPTPVTPPPAPTPPTLVHQIEKFFTPDPPPVQQDNTEAEIPKPAKPAKPVHKDLKLVPVVRTVSHTTDDNAAADAQADAREEKHLRDERRRAIAAVARDIAHNASSATTVKMPGTSSVSYANYASVVKSIYDREWIAPNNAASDNSDVEVSVTIRSDGKVTDSHIVTPSGDSSMDESVRRTLDKVNFIAPFPEGATESERTFLIDFNLNAKRMFG